MASEPEINPFEYIEVVGLNLFNINRDCDDADRCLEDLLVSPKTAFAVTRLKMLSVVGKLKIIRDHRLVEDSSAMRWLIYDQTGRLVDSHPVQSREIQNEFWVYAAFGDFCGQQWAKGSYRLELQWRGSMVMNAVFNVGDIDVDSEYDPNVSGKH